MSFTLTNVRDSVLHWLNDNLSLPFNVVRFDPNNPQAQLFKANCVNVQFLRIDFNTVAIQQMAIDIIHEDENTASEWLQTTWDLLKASFMTGIYDYTTPSSPVFKYANVMWDRNAVVFKSISDGNYVRYSCVLPLKFAAIT